MTDSLVEAGAVCLDMASIAKRVRQAEGWPDLEVSSPSFRGWLELKVDDRVVTQAQCDKGVALIAVGVPVWVVRLRRGWLRVENVPLVEGVGEVADVFSWNALERKTDAELGKHMLRILQKLEL